MTDPASKEIHLVQIAEQRERATKIEGNIGTLEARIDLTNTRITELKEDINRDFERIENRLDRFIKDVDTKLVWLLGAIGGSWLTLMLAIFFKG